LPGVRSRSLADLPDEYAEFVRFFESDSAVSDAVTRFVETGLIQGAGILIVAQSGHITDLEATLTERGRDVDQLRRSGQLVLLDAEATLARAMRDGQPDREIFDEGVGRTFQKLSDRYPRVCTYEEMAGLLWNGGNVAGAIALEQLWRDRAKPSRSVLLFGYPLRSSAQAENASALASIRDAQALHRVIALLQKQSQAFAAQLDDRENFRSLFKQTPEMVCILRGPEHVFEFVNEAHIKALGFDAVGKTLREAQPESIEVHGILDEVYRTGKTAQLHEIPVTVTGRLRYFNLTYAARRNGAGLINGILGLGTEVTEQVQAREALARAKSEVEEAWRRAEISASQLEDAISDRTRELQASRNFLDSVIENIPHMVFIKDARDLRFVSFNRAGEELVGFRRSELIGKNDYDFFPKEQADLFVSKDREVLSGQSVVDIPEEPIETRHQGRRILRTRKIPLFGRDGKPQYLLGVSEDITEWKRSEEERLRMIREQAAVEERKRENERTAFLAEASTVLASSLDYHWTLKELARLAVPILGDWCTVTIVREDRAKERVAAVHRDPEKGALIDELSKCYPASLMDDETGIGRVIKTGKSALTPSVSDSALVATAKDQRHLEIMRELACYSCIIVPIFARGNILGAILVASSREERLYNESDLAILEELGRRAGIAIDHALLYEAAQKAVQARDEFMSIASHELKTPLTSLKLQAQIRARDLQRGELRRFAPERLSQLVAEDEKQVNRLTRLVDDMLDISRIQSGKLSFHPEDFDLNEMVEETLTRFSAQIEASKSGVAFIRGEVAPGHWDRFRIEQVFVNLLTNALKYGAGNPIEVRISVEGGRGYLSVSDRGIGIKREDQDRIFGQFERAISASSISGLGLGLYISRKIVEAHHGRISVRSEEGKGSVFTVELPLVEGSAKGLTTRVISGAPAKRGTGG
jgi:PAS domain S-box-containing protein